MRRFVRHPIDVPIEVRASAKEVAPSLAHDVSFGGLAFRCHQAVEPGIQIDVRIATVRPMFSARARVVWCHCSPPDKGYEVGVSFLDPDDAFAARMVEQICHIEEYRKSVLRREGRALDSEQAAAEWIGRYAETFPNPDRMH
jgi:PilZ domain